MWCLLPGRGQRAGAGGRGQGVWQGETGAGAHLSDELYQRFGLELSILVSFMQAR